MDLTNMTNSKQLNPSFSKLLIKPNRPSIDTENVNILTSNDILPNYVSILTEIWDNIFLEKSRGMRTGIVNPEYEDLLIFQSLHQQYGMILPIYDLLLLVDVFRKRSVIGSATDEYENWLKYMPWVNPKKLSAYERDIQSRKVLPIMPWLDSTFVRPKDCHPFSPPTQIIKTFLPLERASSRKINLVGSDPEEIYYIFSQKSDVRLHASINQPFIRSANGNTYRILSSVNEWYVTVPSTGISNIT